MQIIALTERLRIREFTPDDAPFVFQLLNSPAWLEFIGDRNIRTLEQARNHIINFYVPSYQKYGFGAWQVELIDSNLPIGLACIIKRDELDLPDIGYGFLTEFEGNGYAYEATLAIIEYAKTTLKLPKITAFTTKENLKSIRLMEKVGLKYRKTIFLNNDPQPLLYYTD